MFSAHQSLAAVIVSRLPTVASKMPLGKLSQCVEREFSQSKTTEQMNIKQMVNKLNAVALNFSTKRSLRESQTIEAS
jgi:hypothetical protein